MIKNAENDSPENLRFFAGNGGVACNQLAHDATSSLDSWNISKIELEIISDWTDYNSKKLKNFKLKILPMLKGVTSMSKISFVVSLVSPDKMAALKLHWYV